MTVQLNSIDRWMPLAEGQAIQFVRPSDGVGRVRLQVNCAAPTTFYVETKDGPRLLTSVKAGLETIEFRAAGKFAVFAGEGSAEVHYQTSDTEPTFVRVVDPVIFTKLAQRRARNPELEEMMHRMQLNFERRMSAQAEEVERALAAARKRDEKPAADPEVEGDERDEGPTDGKPAKKAAKPRGGKVPVQEPDGPEPVEETGNGDGGE